MDQDIKNRVDKLVKSIHKAFEKASKKDVIDDVMDSNRLAQISPDNVAAPKGGTLNKTKKTKKRCWEGYKSTPGKKPYSEGSCQKKSEPKMEKSEDFVKDVMQKFEQISTAYLQKQEDLEKARVDQGFGATEKRKMRAERSPGFQPHKKEKITQDGYRQMPKPTDQKALKQKLQSKAKAPKADDLEYPMAASEKKEKPFHGYNSEKHSKEGGLSQKAREKYNKEHGSNLKAPVSSEEAKKSPKKASRRKSFCARMSGVKGETSKDGKPTPKGAALKRWDC